MTPASLRDDIRRMGGAGWLVYAIDRALGRLTGGRAGLCLLRFYLQPVPASSLLPPRPGDPVSVGPIAADRVPEAAFDRPEGAVAQRFADGSTCIAALKGDELLGFMWLQPACLRERIVRCSMHVSPADRVVWDYDFYIAPRYRLGRLFARLWDAAGAHLREGGIEATVSWVHLGNRASAQAHARLGARSIGAAMFVRLFGRQLMLTSLRPWFAWSAPGRTPNLYVDVGNRLPGPERPDSRPPSPPPAPPG